MKKILLSIATLFIVAGFVLANTSSTDATNTNATNTSATNATTSTKRGLGEKIYGIYLESIIKGLLRQTQNLKIRIQNNSFAEENLKTKISEEIDEDIAKLNDLLAQARNATQMQEMKNIRTMLQNHKKDILQLRIRKVLAIINITKFVQSYTKGVEDKIKALETRLGANATQEQKDSIADANTKIQEVKKALTDLLSSISSKPLTEFNKVDINKELRAFQAKINEIKKLISQIPTQIRKETREEKGEKKGETKEYREEKREEKKEEKGKNKNSTTTATTTAP